MTKITSRPTRLAPVRRKHLSISGYLRGNTVYIKLFLNSKTLCFSTGITSSAAAFNRKDLSISTDQQSTLILQSIRTDIHRTFADFELTKRHPDLREIRDIALGNQGINQDKSLVQCLDTFLNKEFKDLEGIEYTKKTVDKKRFLVARIKQYFLTTYGTQHYKLTQVRAIDGQSLVNFCKRTFGHGHNHAVLHAEFLKRALNYGIANEWLEKNPLAFFRPRRERKPVHILTEPELARLEQTTFTIREYIYVKDVFLFCCYTGLSYTDVNTLTTSHISHTADGSPLIRISRGKNGNPCIIPLVKKATDLIQRYSTNPDSLRRKTIFPVYSNQAMNRILKEIQAVVGFETKLTTHVARKTCASYYIAHGVPLTSVATMLGHVKTSTTEQYYTQRSEDSVLKHFQEFQSKVSHN